MSSTAFQRKLDFAPTATIDKVALNNKVVMMRAIVRRAKLHTINALVKKMQKLRNKKGTETQQNQNKNKADRMLEEVRVIKILKPDYVSKYALGSTERFEELVAKPSTSLDMRALARLAQQKFIQDVVDKFRTEHEDWKDLAAYLMTKHTSRDFKKKKTKEKMKKVEANVKASENLVQKFLGEKLKGREDLDKEVDDNDNKDSDESSSSKTNVVNNDDDEVGIYERGTGAKMQHISGRKQNESQNLKNQTSQKQRKTFVGKSNAIDDISETFEEDEDIGDSGEDCNDVTQVTDSDNESTDAYKTGEVESDNDDESNDDDNDSESDNGDDGDIGDDGDTDSSCENEDDSGHISEDSPTKSGYKSFLQKANVSGQKSEKKSNMNRTSPKKKIHKHKDLKSEEGSKITDRKNLVTEKVEGEMIVKKLDLQKNMDEDDIPAILFSNNEDRPVKRKKNRMNLFFDTGKDDDSGSHDNDVNEADDDNDDEKDTEMNNGGNFGSTIQPTMMAFTTCFVGSLKSTDMMSCKDSRYRSNEDWKRIRHESKQNVGRGGESTASFSRGGRGHGPPFRGRGSFRGSSSHVLPQRGRGSFRGSSSHVLPQRGRGSFRGSSSHVLPQRGRGQRFDQTGERSERGKTNPAAESSKQKTLHPSWEASKKRKQEQKGILQAFSGKKVKFDD